VVPLVLYSVIATGTDCADPELGAYCMNSSVEGVLTVTVTVVTVLEVLVVPPLKVAVAVLLMIVPAGTAWASIGNINRLNNNSHKPICP
jgi:hypothetical protein